MNSTSEMQKKNFLDRINPLLLPFILLLTAIFLIWGISKFLTVERSYRTLVNELESKSFGNKWVSAFELSKIINRNGLPENEIPWFLHRMESIYDQAKDARTRDFIIVAVGALKDKRAQGLIKKALMDKDHKVQFNALVALNHYESLDFFNGWNIVKGFLKTKDTLLVQASIFILDKNKIPMEEELTLLLNSEDDIIRYTASIASIRYQKEGALKNIQEIMEIDATSQKKYNHIQIENLKLNVVTALKKYPWEDLIDLMKRVIPKVKNEKVKSALEEAVSSL